MLTKSEIEKMTADEKVELAWTLWDSVYEQAQNTPIPEWQKKILGERLKYAKEHPNEGIPFEEFIERLETRLRHARIHN